MNAARFTVASVAMLVFASPALAQPGDHDAEMAQLLRKITGVVQPGTSKLKDLAPEYVAEKKEGLTWAEAVKEANAHYGDRQPGRAAFLCQYLKKGSRLEDLKELQLPEPSSGIVSGPGHSQCVVFGPKDKPEGRITVWFDEKELLTHEAMLEVFHARIGDMEFEGLGFNGAGTLVSWTYRPLPSNPQGTGWCLWASLLPGEQTPDEYHAYNVTADEMEALTYGTDWVVKRRRVEPRGRP